MNHSVRENAFWIEHSRMSTIECSDTFSLATFAALLH